MNKFLSTLQIFIGIILLITAILKSIDAIILLTTLSQPSHSIGLTVGTVLITILLFISGWKLTMNGMTRFKH